MNVYFSGIGGVGIGPLALIARDIGYDVQGSDAQQSRYTDLMSERGITVATSQDGAHIQKAHEDEPIDWFVYTAALPDDHPELIFARENDIKHTLRGPFVNHIIKEKNLQLVAVSGTHGKTTTTGMIIWACKKLDLPISYAIGTNISFGASGKYAPGSKFFVYEADEYAKQFLDFSPHASVVTSIEHDHPDSYPTTPEYYEAFTQFLSQSEHAYGWEDDLAKTGVDHPTKHINVWSKSTDLGLVSLPGIHNRQNSFLAAQLMMSLFPDVEPQEIFRALDSFPGTERRFEMLAQNLYTDYAHHPTEVTAVIQMARELSNNVVIIYQPHQNRRQHDIINAGGYDNTFEGAEQVYWLPTYLSREDPKQAVLTPQELINSCDNPEDFEAAACNDDLLETIRNLLLSGKLVILMTAGDADQWLRSHLDEILE